MESAETASLVNNGDTLSTLSPHSSQPLAGATTSPRSSDVNPSDHTDAPSVTQEDAPPDVIPPYFNGLRLERTDSAANATGHGGGIDLVDQSDEDHEVGRACWASNVSVDDYVVVSGPTGIGAYVVWNFTIETFKGGTITLRKRFVNSMLKARRHS